MTCATARAIAPRALLALALAAAARFTAADPAVREELCKDLSDPPAQVTVERVSFAPGETGRK